MTSVRAECFIERLALGSQIMRRRYLLQIQQGDLVHRPCNANLNKHTGQKQKYATDISVLRSVTTKPSLVGLYTSKTYRHGHWLRWMQMGGRITLRRRTHIRHMQDAGRKQRAACMKKHTQKVKKKKTEN